jgi:hypothetical protein
MSEYQEMFQLVDPWLGEILEVVKKDLKQEHLKKDKAFCKRYFLGKGAAQVSVEEMVPAYRSEIAAGNVGLAEFIASRWLLKNTDIYGFFEKKLEKISPDFDQLDSLEEAFALQLKSEAQKEFKPVRLYLFSVLNAVTFSSEIFTELRENALNYTAENHKLEQERKEKEDLEAMQRRHDREVRALVGKFEKKLSGMERKYVRDTDTLKDQIRSLSRKLDEARSAEVIS